MNTERDEQIMLSTAYVLAAVMATCVVIIAVMYALEWLGGL